MDTMDDMKLAPPPGTEGAVESLKAVDSWYGKQVVRLKSGEVNALRFKDKWGRFTTSDEDVAAKFLSGETPVNDFVQALGGRPSARAALESFTERLFTEKAIYPDLHPKAGMVNVKAAAKFVQQHEAALKQFPDVQRKIEGAVQWENIAAKYRAESDAILKNPDAVTRLRNPILTGDVDELTRRHSELLALRDRTVKEWEKSTASDFMGLDADRAAQTIVRSTKPNAMLADLSKRIGTDRDAQNGLNKALWDAALDKFSSERLDLLDNRALLTTKMTKFLRENEEWMTSRFGAERVSHMRKSADALTILDRTGRPVLPGGSDTMANLSSAMVDWGPFFSRLYAEQSGRIGTAWLISERIGRVIGGLLKSQSEQGAMHLLEQAFYDPHVAQTWMLAAKQGEQHLLEQRLRHILVPKLYGALPLVENGQQSTGP